VRSVISGGAGVLVLEDIRVAEARGAKILAILEGAAATSDGEDMVAPNGKGAVAAMEMALRDAEVDSQRIDYINLHGTSTPAGDLKEIEAIRSVFGATVPSFSSTKSMTGHALGAAGALEAIFCILMMQDNFLAPNINLDNPEPAVADLPVVRETRNQSRVGLDDEQFLRLRRHQLQRCVFSHPDRRMRPAPGTATEQDAEEAESHTGKICELIDGVLVAKAMGTYESAVAIAVSFFLKVFLQDHRLGVVLGPDGLLRIQHRQIRVPDVSFISWQRLGSRRLSDHPILPVAPDLAVEVLSSGNTAAEMDRKLREYFASDVRLVWYIDPETQTAKSYTSAEHCDEIAADGSLRGEPVLLGFELSLRRLFAEAEGTDLAAKA
jgi:Uma2 family endonuclease